MDSLSIAFLQDMAETLPDFFPVFAVCSKCGRVFYGEKWSKSSPCPEPFCGASSKFRKNCLGPIDAIDVSLSVANSSKSIKIP